MRIAPFVLLPILAACTVPAPPLDQGRILTEADFRERVAGKTARSDLATITVAEDGTISGVSDGQAIAGTWEWRDGFFCRTITSPVLTPEDCQVWQITEDELIITRDMGTGGKLIYDLPHDG